VISSYAFVIPGLAPAMTMGSEHGQPANSLVTPALRRGPWSNCKSSAKKARYPTAFRAVDEWIPAQGRDDE
jgi:hypothetical protein